MRLVACVVALVGRDARRLCQQAAATAAASVAHRSGAEAQASEDEYARLRALPLDEIDHLGLLHEIRFDYDQGDISEGARVALARNARVLQRSDFLRVTVAKVTYDNLVALGVASDWLATLSSGKEAPLCLELASPAGRGSAG